MSAFADMMSLGAWQTLAAVHQSASATYTDPAGSAIADLTVVFIPGPSDYDEGEIGALEMERGMICIPQSDLASPARKGVWTIGSDGWTIVLPPTLEAGIWHCECASADARSVPPERG